jgi:cellulose synthase/poly-beta-1,6-N-acetylglucosamine synthase-like glycosyltransferase
MGLKVIFWISTGIIFYAYFGYTLLLALIVLLQGLKSRRYRKAELYEPEVTLLIPAYNEADSIEAKMTNTRELDYPAEKLKVIWITDGSDDGSVAMLGAYQGISVFHETLRCGKIHAMNRGIKMVSTPLVVFTDANTMLNREAIREIVTFFADPGVGCVAGEKRIKDSSLEKAVEAGEGLYWQYESLIKRLESEIGSAVGAVGELFAVRTELYEEIREDTILDDFAISLQIATRGYSIKYAPSARGTETASVSVREELKRKIRIACGGWQMLFRMNHLLNPFLYGFLSWKYFSHKVMRWTLVPFSFLVSLFCNAIIAGRNPVAGNLYGWLFLLQLLFYLTVLWGMYYHNARIRLRFLFAPYYLFIMNYAIIAGMLRYFTGNYSVKWEKAKRA